jgi:hypothetical protein
MFNDFVTQIQSDEIASREGSDWVNDIEDSDYDDEFDND